MITEQQNLLKEAIVLNTEKLTHMVQYQMNEVQMKDENNTLAAKVETLLLMLSIALFIKSKIEIP